MAINGFTMCPLSVIINCEFHEQTWRNSFIIRFICGFVGRTLFFFGKRAFRQSTRSHSLGIIHFFSTRVRMGITHVERREPRFY